MNEFRQALEQSLSLAASGELDDALAKLGKSLDSAVVAGDHKWAALLSRNAGLLCDQKGELEKALVYYQTSVQHDPSDPYIHYSLGEVCSRVGHQAAAREWYLSSREIAVQIGDADLIKMLDERLAICDG